jgi:hypothetical protein
MTRASLQKDKIPLNPPLLKGEELLRHGGVSPLKDKIPLNPPDQRVTFGFGGLLKGPVLLCINQRGRDVSLCDTGQGGI